MKERRKKNAKRERKETTHESSLSLHSIHTKLDLERKKNPRNQRMKYFIICPSKIIYGGH
jgi:hypothetical protein